MRLSLIRRVLFGSDSFRASAMLGPYYTPRYISANSLDREFCGAVPHHSERTPSSLPRQPFRAYELPKPLRAAFRYRRRK